MLNLFHVRHLMGLLAFALFVLATGVVAEAKDAMDRGQVNGEISLPSLEQLVTSPFGLRNDRRKWGGTRIFRREHRGVDLKAPRGWPVISFREGEVIQVGPSGAAGIIAKVRQRDGMTVVYAHLDKVVVAEGQKVAQGQTLGEVGCTGRTTGSHLHLAMRKADNSLVDPLLFVKRAEDVFRPNPEQIPKTIVAEACRRMFLPRGRSGRPISIRHLRALEESLPPPIPVWQNP